MRKHTIKYDCQYSKNGIDHSIPSAFEANIQFVSVGICSRLLEDLASVVSTLSGGHFTTEDMISRWTSGFPNLTLKSIAEISTALGEPLVRVVE